MMYVSSATIGRDYDSDDGDDNAAVIVPWFAKTVYGLLLQMLPPLLTSLSQFADPDATLTCLAIKLTLPTISITTMTTMTMMLM